MRSGSEAIELTGTGLFVFSDPGGAKSVLSKALELKSEGKEVYLISDRRYSFYDDFFPLTINEVPINIDDFIYKMKPNYLFTGTSYTSDIELKFLTSAKKNNIPTLSFIDHWTNFKSRFYFKDQYVYPDRILVIDQKAREIAINEGLNEGSLFVYDNPYYKYLRMFQPRLGKIDFFSNCNIDVRSQKIITFAPDPLSNINGLSIYGFDELTATKAIAEIINDIEGDFLFFIKLHPNQNKENIKKVIGPRMTILDSSVDNNTLIYYSDLIIGFFSNFLIEADLMNKRVIRFLLTKSNNDPLDGKNIGSIVESKSLRSAIENVLDIE
jgi:hypothetical protein